MSAPVDIHKLFAEAIQRDSEDLGGHSRLSSLRDRAAARLAALRFNPGRNAPFFALIVFNIVYFGGQLLRWAL